MLQGFLSSLTRIVKFVQQIYLDNTQMKQTVDHYPTNFFHKKMP